MVARFGDPERPQVKGRYMVHCHNLVHEDHDMMSQFAVGWKPGEVDDCDPILTAPFEADDLPDSDTVAPGPCRAPRVRPGPGRVVVSWGHPPTTVTAESPATASAGT